MNALTRKTLDALGWHHASDSLAAHASPSATHMIPLVQVWERQIDEASRHGTEAVDQLTTIFVGIERQLAEAIEATMRTAAQMRSGSVTESVSGMDTARDRLLHVMSMIEEAVQANHALFDSVRNAVDAVKELSETAQSVEKIAQMTALLSINARIEAARAGAAGQGFAVVADEVRRLAAESRRESQAIMTRVARIDSVILQAADAAAQLKVRDHHLIQHSRDEIQSVLDDVGAAVQDMMQASETLGEIGQHTRASVGEALVQFQFQDRVSQRLAHVQTSLQDFSHQLEDGAPGPDQVNAMDQRLLKSYTMPDEGRIHRGEAAAEPAASGLIMF